MDDSLDAGNVCPVNSRCPSCPEAPLLEWGTDMTSWPCNVQALVRVTILPPGLARSFTHVGFLLAFF